MPIHVVNSGECFSVIAQRYGFADYKTLYNHPDNADLKKKRPNPNLIYPGDQIVIPEKGDKTTNAATGKTHKFTLKRPQKALRVVLQNHEGKALAGEAGVLTIGGHDINVTSDGNGQVEQMVPIDEREATLKIAGRVLNFRFGNLNPMADAPDGGVTGGKGRLKNLGYAVPDAENTMDDATRAAVALFQHDHKLDATGELDDATAKKLASTHGC